MIRLHTRLIVVSGKGSMRSTKNSAMTQGMYGLNRADLSLLPSPLHPVARSRGNKTPFPFYLSVCNTTTYCQLFCFDLCKFYLRQGTSAILLSSLFLCVCPLPMMRIHCWVYIYIPIFQWWESLFFGCLLFLPSIFLMPMECIFFSYMEQYFITRG